MVTRVDYTVLYKLKFAERVELKCPHKNINMWGDSCAN